MLFYAGGWFNYVATLTVIERLAGDHGLLVSLVLITRMLPSLLLFPAAGVAADRCPQFPLQALHLQHLLACMTWLGACLTESFHRRYSREMVLVASNVTAACAVTCFTLVQRAQDIWSDPSNLTTYRTDPFHN